MHASSWSRLSLLAYACTAAFLFIYALPFAFCGFDKGPDPLICRDYTIFDVWGEPRQTYGYIPDACRWFAVHKAGRMWLVVGIALICVAVQFWPRQPWVRTLVLHIVIWCSLAVFLFQYIGMMLVLITL